MEAINTINYFTLTTGVLELHFDKIVIFDDAKKNHLSKLVTSIILFLFGIALIFRGVKNNDNFLLYMGIILFLTTIFSSIKRNEFKRVDNEINLKDISKVTFKEFRDDTIIAKIITRQKRIREITIDNNDNIAIQFMRKLKELNINVSLD
jgi:hypothetical protein